MDFLSSPFITLPIPILFLILLPWFLAHLELKDNGDQEGVLIVRKKMIKAFLIALALGVFLKIIDPPPSGDFDYFSGLTFLFIGVVLNVIILGIKGLFCLRFAKRRVIELITQKETSTKK